MYIFKMPCYIAPVRIPSYVPTPRARRVAAPYMYICICICIYMYIYWDMYVYIQDAVLYSTCSGSV